jgi:hypothetical protein
VQKKWLEVVWFTVLVLGVGIHPVQAEDLLTEQAVNLCKAERDRLTLNHGDDWFFWITSGSGRPKEIFQVRSISQTVDPRPISEADKLNGFDWKGESHGEAVYTAITCRTHQGERPGVRGRSQASPATR